MKLSHNNREMFLTPNANGVELILETQSQTLQWIVFYRTKQGEGGALCSSPNSLPIPTAAAHFTFSSTEPRLSIQHIEQFTEIFLGLVEKDVQTTTFHSAHPLIRCLGCAKETIEISLQAENKGLVALLAKLDTRNFMGTSLVYLNKVLSAQELDDALPESEGLTQLLTQALQKAATIAPDTQSSQPPAARR